MATVPTDRHLLFGLLALQNGLIDQGKLVAAFQAWTLDKGRALADHLVARGDLDADDRSAVEALVARHLKKHGDSTEKSLAAIPAVPSLQRSLLRIGDPEIGASLAVLRPETDGVGALARIAEQTGAFAGITLAETDPGPELALAAGGPQVLDGTAGRYQILGEIARGGMGLVLRGRDPDLGRDLALKVLLDHHRGRSDLVDRFVEEAQICGQLQHPGIVPVYELSTLADHRPFFTMKLVKGRTLAALLAERSSPVDDLPRFLSIFEAVCQTMAYAHARAVIHRDLKPSNMMVGSFGEVQVMDWGLAKVLPKDGKMAPDRATPSANETVVATLRSEGNSDLSQAGSVLGTPAYMAPEQARGEIEAIDRRTDVFSLGSILCEILTGASAFSGRTAIEIIKAAGRADTAAALERLEHCGTDEELCAMARACLAALTKDRPADAGVVAKRITAYLAGVQQRLREAELSRAAESARAQGAEAKASAERRARRLTAALAATVLLAGLLGGSGWRWVELQRLERVRQASGRVNVALQDATRLRGLAQGAAVGDLGLWAVAAVAAEKARELLAPGVEPALRKQVEDLAAELAVERQRAEAVAKVAERDRTLLDRLVDIRSAEADDRGGWSTDAAYADAFREAGLDVATLPAEDAVKQILGRPSAVATALAAAVDDWAAIRRDRRKDRAGAAALSALASAADPDPWRFDLRVALDLPDQSARLAALRRLAKATPFGTLGPISLDLLGRALKDAGDASGAEAVLRRAQQRYPADVWINYDLASSLEKMARREEAIRYYTAARSLRPETAHSLAHALGDKGERDEEIAVFEDLRRLRPGIGRHLGCLGKTMKDRGRSREGDAILEEAVAANREAGRLRPDDAYAHFSLGFALSLQGKRDEAIAAYRTAIRLQPEDAVSHDNLCELLGSQGKIDEAIAEHRIAIRIQPDFANAHNTIGSILQYVKRDYGAAAMEYREAVRLQPDNALFHYNLGSVLDEQNKLDEAIAEYRASSQIRHDEPHVFDALAWAHERQGKLDEAIAEYRAALRIQPDSARIHNNLGDALLAQSKLDLAIAEYRTAIQIEPSYVDAHMNLGWTLHLQDKLDEGITELRTAIQIEPGRVLAHTNLARVLDRRGKRDEAIIEYRTLLRLKADEHWCRGQLVGLLERQGKLDEAIAENRTLLRLKPDDDSARGDLVRLLERQGKLDEGLTEFRDWLRLHPGSAGAHDSYARVLVLSPERQPRHYDEGLVHARRAVELAKDGENHFGTLALAEYRSGHWAESLAASDRSLELGKGGGASEWFVQSVARWQKGDKDEARKWLDKAVAWTKKNDPKNAELLAFWREAALLLGQPGPSAAAPPLADLPADVFARPEAAR